MLNMNSNRNVLILYSKIFEQKRFHDSSKLHLLYISNNKISSFSGRKTTFRDSRILNNKKFHFFDEKANSEVSERSRLVIK